MNFYSLKKTITKGISGGVRGSIIGGGAMVTQTGAGLESAIATGLSFLIGFLFSAAKNYWKNG